MKAMLRRFGVFAVAGLVFMGLVAAGYSQDVLVINEIDYDQPSTDAAEFIEIYNASPVGAPANLDAYALQFINGSGGGAVPYQTFDLPDVDLAAGDYFVVSANAATVPNTDLDVSPDTNLIQNGAPDAVALIWRDAVSTVIVDTVSYEGSVPGYTEDSGDGLTDTPDDGVTNSISRLEDGWDTDQNNQDFAWYPSTPGEANDSGIDWGDAADPTYPTLALNSGASHTILPGFYLGAGVDGDADGQPTANADGDDLGDGNDDEDGVVFTSLLTPGMLATVDVTASMAGVLDAWVDFDADGSWLEPGDQIFLSQPLAAGVNNLAFPVPIAAPTGNTYARFRLSLQGVPSFEGDGGEGEVEDYLVRIGEPEPEEMDWGDAPDPTYPTLSASGGANHTIVQGIFMGAAVDAEPDGQPSADALGDDMDILYPPPMDDEDGVSFNSLLVAGQIATATVTVSVPGYLNAWVDFDNDGGWQDPRDRIATSLPLVAGPNPVSFQVPNDAAGGGDVCTVPLLHAAGSGERGRMGAGWRGRRLPGVGRNGCARAQDAVPAASRPERVGCRR